VPRLNVKKQVLNYLAEHKDAEDHEIAEALNLHIVDVLDVLILLDKDGLVRSETI
jgi:transcription initiation factor IIE alpha subunit